MTNVKLNDQSTEEHVDFWDSDFRMNYPEDVIILELLLQDEIEDCKRFFESNYSISHDSSSKLTLTKQSSTSNISNVIGGRFPPPPPAGVCGLVTARSKPTVTQILATRGSSDDYFWRHVKKIPQYSDCVIELLSSNDMQLSDNVICEVSKVQNAIDRFDKLSPCLQDILLPRLISQVTELSSFYSNTSQSQQHASTETDKNVSIASNTTRADLDALECLGKRGRYYYDVRPEEEYLGGGIEVLAGGGEGEGGDTTTLTEISRNENKVLTSRHGGLLSTSWHDLLNGYNDDHDGSYLESFIDKSCLRARNLRYKKVKKTNNAIEVEKETNRVMFPIVVPVPVSVCHPASWGPNTRRDRDATRAIPVSIIHPACVSRTILYPPCSSRYLDNSHDSAGGAEVDDMYLEYIHSREMLAAQSAINCCNIAQLLSCCEREETIKKLKDRRDVLYNHAINAERFLRTLPGGSLATCSKKKTRESSKRAAVETTVIPSSTPVSSSDNLQNRVGACRVEWLEDPLFLRNLSVGMRVEVCLKGNTWTLAEVCIVHVDAQANPRSVKVRPLGSFHGDCYWIAIEDGRLRPEGSTLPHFISEAVQKFEMVSCSKYAMNEITCLDDHPSSVSDSFDLFMCGKRKREETREILHQEAIETIHVASENGNFCQVT